jgi:hypothetical protein
LTVKRVTSQTAKDLTIALEGIANYVAKVGWVARKQYPGSNMTTAEVGAIAEGGSTKNKILPRPVIRPAIISETPKWQRIMRIEAKKMLEGKQTAQGGYEVLGLEAAGAIRKNISTLLDPPLKLSTIKARERQYSGRLKTRRGRRAQIAKRIATGKITKPLVFTKYFLNSCTNVVERE